LDPREARDVDDALAGAGWLSVTVVLASLTLYLVGLDKGIVGIRLQHRDTRVHAR
jgi:hypothetical protein